MSISKRTTFFIEWDAKFAGILKRVTLSQSLRGTVAVHIFYSPSQGDNCLPPYKPWILKHPILAMSKEGLWKMMECYVLRFNFDASYSLTHEKQSRSHGNGESGKCGTTDQYSYYILSSSQERSEDLARKVCYERGVRLGIITDVESTNLLDFLNFKCDICKIAFKKKGELRQHNQLVHGLTCLNIKCRYSKKENAFNNETDLRVHLGSQLRCVFCPTKVFCSSMLLDNHMKSTHKQCGCGCGKFFVSRTAYLDHFFSTYPSPKDIASIPRPPTKSEELDLRKSAGMLRRQNEDMKIEISVHSEDSPPACFPDENEDAICDSTSEKSEEPDLDLRSLNEENDTSDTL